MMKKFIAIVCLAATIFSLGESSARIGRQAQLKITGSVVAVDGTAIEYATVVLLTPEGNQAAGTVTSHDGSFELTSTKGAFTLTISYLGYDDTKRDLTLENDLDLGIITLAESATQIEALTIKGNLITREADRFVMNVAESPLSSGRTTYEMLSLAPGVWVKDDEVKINGKSGAKIFINDREVRMTGNELVNYLKAIPAENIQKIEVYPMSGADQDASNAGGMIKITVRRQRNDGVSGSVGLRGDRSWYGRYSYSPSFNLNYNSGKLNLYGNGSFYSQVNDYDDATKTSEVTEYANGAVINASVGDDSVYSGAGGMVGAVYDLDERNSIGAEYNIWMPIKDANHSISISDFTLGANRTSNNSLYDKTSDGINNGLTLNYIHKIDSLGSTFKVIGDYARSTVDTRNVYRNTATDFVNDIAQGAPKDSLYNSSAAGDYRIATLTAAVEKNLSATSVLKYGAKLTLTDTYSHTEYSSHNSATDAWEEQTMLNRKTDYSEYIGAVYGSYSKRFTNGMSFVAGLRGEYTNIPELDKQYFDLFPNVNFMLPLNLEKGILLTAAYTRKIRRPWFWAMNPQRTQLSQYSYQEGNPDLKPMYSNDISLTGVLFSKYTLTLGAQLLTNQVQQVCEVDKNDPNVLGYYFVNLANNYQYYANLNAPIELTDWWSMNINLTAIKMDQRIYADSDVTGLLSVMGSASTSISLPHKWSLDVNGNYMSKVMVGNLTQLPMCYVSAMLKKRLCNDKLTATFGVENLLPTATQRVLSSTPGSFEKTLTQPDARRFMLRASITYNFQAGKMFRAKNVESGAGDEKGRMGGGSK